MSKFKDISTIPISVLNVLNPFVQKAADIFERVPFEEGYIKYQGKGINKNFYFSIIACEGDSKGVIISVEFKPSSINSAEKTGRNISEKQLDTFLKNWYDLLCQYLEHEKTFSEPERFSKITEEFYSEFNFVNDEENEFFSIPEMVRIDSTLEQLENWVDENEGKFLPVLYQQIKREIIETQEGLHENTKGWIAKRVAKIYAQILKQGPRFLKETAVEVAKATIAEIMKTKMIG